MRAHCLSLVPPSVLLSVGSVGCRLAVWRLVRACARAGPCPPLRAWGYAGGGGDGLRRVRLHRARGRGGRHRSLAALRRRPSGRAADGLGHPAAGSHVAPPPTAAARRPSAGRACCSRRERSGGADDGKKIGGAVPLDRRRLTPTALRRRRPKPPSLTPPLLTHKWRAMRSATSRHVLRPRDSFGART